MSADDKLTLAERLRNPEWVWGHHSEEPYLDESAANDMLEAASALEASEAKIAALTAENATLREALAWYADRKNWLSRNTSSDGYHETNPSGTMERQVGQCGGMVHGVFQSDCGDRARAALRQEGKP